MILQVLKLPLLLPAWCTPLTLEVTAANTQRSLPLNKVLKTALVQPMQASNNAQGESSLMEANWEGFSMWI